MRIPLRRALTGVTAAAIAAGGLLVFTGAPAYAASTCSSDCINVTDISGGVDGAEFTFNTTGLSRVKVIVTELNGQSFHSVKNDDSWGSSYDITDSDPSYYHQGTVYRYGIYATDTAGATWAYTGEFETLVRTASIHYNKLHVINDGDVIGAGDWNGAGRCQEGVWWDDMSPLSQIPVDAYEMEVNNGDNVSLNATSACTGEIGSAIEAETAMGDDDAPYIGADPTFWLAKSPYLFERWSVPNYDSSYSDQFVGDPLPPTAIGSGTAPISMTSLTHDPVGYPAQISYSVTGTATFTHTRPPVNFPAPLSFNANLHLAVAQGFNADVANVTWKPFTLPAAFYVATATRVFWKEHDASTWTHTDMLDPDDTSYQLSNLKLGSVYDFAVARVMPGGLLALYSTTTYATAPIPQPTSILGWSTTTTKATVGKTVTSHIQVTTGWTARNVVLQSKKAGATTWATVATVLTTSAGDATLTFKVASVNTQWRVHVPATANFNAANSAARLLIPKTVI